MPNIFNFISSLADDKSKSKQLSQLTKKLNWHKKSLSLYSPEGSEVGFVAAMDQFLEFISTYDDVSTYAAFEKAQNFAQYQTFFSPYFLRLAWEMEEKTYDLMMASRLEPGQKLKDIMGDTTKNVYCRISDTFKLIDFSNCHKFALLGCGKVPVSLFSLHDQTEIPSLVGIDNLPEAVGKANILVDKFSLNRISIIRDDASTLDMSAFDVIYWGQFAAPRKAIMENILATAGKNCTIILRDPFLTGTLGFESVMPYLDKGFKICAQSEEQPGRFMLKHYILRLK